MMKINKKMFVSIALILFSSNLFYLQILFVLVIHFGRIFGRISDLIAEITLLLIMIIGMMVMDVVIIGTTEGCRSGGQVIG